jgi:hypothetical protein
MFLRVRQIAFFVYRSFAVVVVPSHDSVASITRLQDSSIES